MYYKIYAQVKIVCSNLTQSFFYYFEKLRLLDSARFGLS